MEQSPEPARIMPLFDEDELADAVDSADPVCQKCTDPHGCQVAAIAASIKEWGWTTPALVGEDGGLIAGHAGCSPPGSSASPRSR